MARRGPAAGRYNAAIRDPTSPVAHLVTQLVLDLGAVPAPTLDNFVPGDNAEPLAAARALAAGTAASRFLYLWGPQASGRTHLLHAIAIASSGTSRRLGPGSSEADFVHDAQVGTWLVDDVHALDATRQAAAFHLFEAVSAGGRARFAAAGEQPPARLPVMPELATRLGFGLVLQLRRLSDDDMAHALRVSLAERGVTVSDDVVPWLMTHAPRDLGRLRALVDALDTHALVHKRAITLPLLRGFLQARLPLPGADGDLA